MDWTQLLSTQKLAPEEAEPKQFEDYPINAFEKDFNKIVSSAVFRRLQDKTQVFPLDKSDFIRTRLTHSIEVSTIARQLGIMVSKNTTPHRPVDITPSIAEDISSVLLCAGLLHDLGNPPFGHFGEAVIGAWFQNNLKTIPYKNRKTVRELLSDQMAADLEHFEGNAQAFRILAKAKHASGINLSAAVMSALVKYPVDSRSADSENPDVRRHKTGYFLAEKDVFFQVAGTVGTLCEDGTVTRHPLAYLLEAADDIAYRTADLEDAFKKGLFTLPAFIDFFEAGYDHASVNVLCGSTYTQEHYSDKLLSDLKRRLEQQPEEDAFSSWMKYTRQWLMHNTVFRFSHDYAQIMGGTCSKELFFDVNHTLTMQIFESLMKEFVFCSPGILKLELSAQTILSFLLDRFIRAVLYYGYEETDYKLTQADKKLLHLLSENYRNDYEASKTGDEAYDLYLRLLMVTDYISGMTDSYARTLYRELSGIE